MCKHPGLAYVCFPRLVKYEEHLSLLLLHLLLHMHGTALHIVPGPGQLGAAACLFTLAFWTACSVCKQQSALLLQLQIVPAAAGGSLAGTVRLGAAV